MTVRREAPAPGEPAPAGTGPSPLAARTVARTARAPLGRIRAFAIALASALGAAGPAAAGPAPRSAAGMPVSGCEAVLRALALVDAQPRLHLRLDVDAGHHPDGIRRLELHRADGRERWVLDGRALRTTPTAGGAADTLMLAPEGDCERDTAGPADAAAVRYDAFAERGQSRVALWIDPASGLPSRVRREGPELARGPSLSRPGKPPQTVLRPTGGRSVETITFRYGAAATPHR